MDQDGVESVQGDATSEAVSEVQDDGRGVPQGTNPALGSEATVSAQEQPTAQPANRQLSAAELERRSQQSAADRARAEHERALQLARLQAREEARQELVAQQAREAEQARIASMSDEQYGAYQRTIQQTEELENAARAETHRQWGATVRATMLAEIDDEDARKEIATRELQGEFKSPADFMKACISVVKKTAGAKEVARKTSAIRQAVANEQVAEEAASGGPDLGTGRVAPALNNMSSGDLILLGIRQAEKNAR